LNLTEMRIFFTQGSKYVGPWKFSPLETKIMAQTYAMLQVFFIDERNSCFTLILKNYTIGKQGE
jgi:hypothetical protein